MTVLEAKASGIPKIISPAVGAKDLVTEGINGYIAGETPWDGPPCCWRSDVLGTT